MIYLKGSFIHYNHLCDVYVNIEYDQQSNSTIETRKIIMQTIVAGDVQLHENDIVDKLEKRYNTDSFAPCSKADYEKYNIGDKL